MSTLNGKMNGKSNMSDLNDDHLMSSIETPLREDAFELDEELKVELIQKKFEEIMQVLGLDMNDDSLKDTPKRVAKMFVKEIFKGLSPENKPSVSLFDNKYQYKQMLVERDVNVSSTCEHHFLPIYGKAHVAYMSTGKVIGLSKINRIVEYYSKRPQVQERLTIQVANELKQVLETDDVAVMIDASHMCVASRGIQDVGSSTVTAEYCGKFNDPAVKQEFLRYINK
ncbi:MAG: GTP cyclohydrolase I FolE [Bacteroidia bacterium]